MRELTDHKVNPANDVLTVAAIGEPGIGGAHHHYRVTSDHPSFHVPTDIVFQHGPINEAGVNGLTHEVLLAIVADRMRDFQRGPFANRYNALALEHIEDARNLLNSRNLERMRRGVEGTHKA